MELEFDLPTPLVFTIGEPWILYRGRLYQTGDPMEDVSDNYFELNGMKFGLGEIATPKRLEELYFLRHSDGIERASQDYMRRAANTEYRSKKAIEEELGRNKVLSLLITKVLPVITNFNADEKISRMIEEEQGIEHEGSFLDQMLTNTGSARSGYHSSDSAAVQRDAQNQKARLLENIARQYGQFEISNNGFQQANGIIDQLSQAIENRIGAEISPLLDGSILSSQIFPGRNIMYYKKGIYELVEAREWIGYFRQFIEPGFYRRLQRIPASREPDEIYDIIKENLQLVEKRYLSRLINKLKTSKLKISGRYYFPILMQGENLDEVLSLYKKLIEKQVKLAAVEHNEFQTLQMSEIARQREQLSRIADLHSFELNGAGYELKDGGYYVYVTTPEFALKSPHFSDAKHYLPFPPAKIGVKVSYDNYAEKYVIGNPLVMNQYRHPFLSARASMQQICLGSYKPSSARVLQPDQAIQTLLSKAQEIIMMGYRRGNNPYQSNELTKDRWRSWITKREMERRGLVCLNDFRR